jgi:hypothetical protein
MDFFESSFTLLIIAFFEIYILLKWQFFPDSSYHCNNSNGPPKAKTSGRCLVYWKNEIFLIRIRALLVLTFPLCRGPDGTKGFKPRCRPEPENVAVMDLMDQLTAQ